MLSKLRDNIRRMIHAANLVLGADRAGESDRPGVIGPAFSGIVAAGQSRFPAPRDHPVFPRPFHRIRIARVAVALFTTAASIFGIVRERRIFVSNWRIEAVFSGAFAYALAWRYAFPDIDASSEKMTDLTFIANYMDGARLPPVDRWLPPFRFDMYYALRRLWRSPDGADSGDPGRHGL